MVKHPNFKLEANGKDITDVIRANLISLNFDDKEGSKSDEISFSVSGIYAKPVFGDNLKLWLGYGDDLYLCGSFSVQTTSADYKANTTEVRATAVNFASPQKIKKRRSWEKTTVFEIAKKIAAENKLAVKTSGQDQNIASVLQNNVGDLDFLYGLCFDYGFIMAVKNATIIIASKDAKGDETQTSNTPKNESLPTFALNLTDLYSLEITEANRNSYTAVIVEWQDIEAGKVKSIKVGSGEQVYKMQIAQPKSDNEAFKQAEAKLNELQRGGINGRCSCEGKNIIAGGKIKFGGVPGLEANEFSIKEVSHKLSTSGYEIDIEFEG
ncbi:phage tail protein [Campylobacter concisus]|uniref:Phage tail protein n=1 Tax=Campylobacter concisus TaxID=199 RepID=A0A1Y5MR38_9BACT|nr:phage tail protein [Campylobacter concisus]OUT11060.1 phage tail protein [Campylobacter concisus]